VADRRRCALGHGGPGACPPDGERMAPERPRAPQRLRRAPVNAAVIPQSLAWDPAPQTPATRERVATRLADDHLPTPRGGPRGHVASGRGLRRAPV
jgi:hypothetical protein